MSAVFAPHADRAAAANRPASATTARALAFVAAHRADAEQLGRDLADEIGNPDAFATALAAGLRRLADPDHLTTQQVVAPGAGSLLGVRWPLLDAVGRGFQAETRDDRPSTLLFLADRLLREEHLELRWFGFGLLEQTIGAEPERTWQLLRRAARAAGDWITVDTLARAYARGILAEPYRWAELEQLVFAPSRWERRLVGSTIATIPHVDRRAGREPVVVERALPLLGQLIGDAEPDVQKALSWAYRTIAQVDPTAAGGAMEHEAARAAATQDGHRAWVIRDALPKLDPPTATALKHRLAGIRRRHGAPSTSAAAQTAAQFRDLGLGRPMPEPPLR